MIKLQLYNELAGSLTVQPDAEGTEDFEQTLKRSEATDGVVFEYSLDLQFNKIAKAYLRDVFDLGGGIEAVVIVNAFEYKPNAFKWEQIGDGTIKFVNFDVSDLRVKTSIEQTGFQRKVLNLFETDVDLETTKSQGGLTIPATPYLDLLLHSKTIVKESVAMPGELVEFQQLDVFSHDNLPGAQTTYRERIIYGQIDTTKAELKELEDTFALSWGWVDFGTLGVTGPATVGQTKAHIEAELAPRINMATTTEAGVVDVEILLQLKHEIIASDPSGDVDVCGNGALGQVEVHAWYEHRDANNNIKTVEHIGEFTMPNCGARSDNNISTGTLETLPLFTIPGVVIEVNDKIYVYETVRIYGDYDVTGIGDESVEHHFRVTPGADQYIRLKASTVTPSSTAKAYLIDEALTKMFQHYTDQIDCFRSSYFQRTDSVIPVGVDGPGSLRTVLSGASIRKVPGKTTFVNGKDILEALNAIDCLGMGFEVRDGKQVAVIEQLKYFYNKDSLILDLGPVSELHRLVDSKQYFNLFESNYGKIDIQKTNGIDEPATKRVWKLPITQISRRQLATTKYKVSGYEIEDQRRKADSTEDSKNDENNFFIDLIRDGLGFKPRKMEGFTLVDNVIDPASSYNINFWPRRNIDNWLQVIAIPLYKAVNKVIEFASGEGNYFAVTQKTGEPAPKPEGGPGVTIDLAGVEPLYMPERYTFKCKFTADQMKLVRDNPYGYFRFQEYKGGPNLEGYLSKVSREAKKNLGTFELLKVFR